jgi:hypothetical protein
VHQRLGTIERQDEGCRRREAAHGSRGSGRVPAVSVDAIAFPPCGACAATGRRTDDDGRSSPRRPDAASTSGARDRRIRERWLVITLHVMEFVACSVSATVVPPSTLACAPFQRRAFRRGACLYPANPL